MVAQAYDFPVLRSQQWVALESAGQDPRKTQSLTIRLRVTEGATQGLALMSGLHMHTYTQRHKEIYTYSHIYVHTCKDTLIVDHLENRVNSFMFKAPLIWSRSLAVEPFLEMMG